MIPRNVEATMVMRAAGNEPTPLLGTAFCVRGVYQFRHTRLPMTYATEPYLLGEPLRRSAAPKGFPDENAAWIDGLAQRLDVANQLARRVAATTDPELAVEAVRGGAGRRHRTGLTGI
jgi:uncharacterized protein (DUF1800 family)